MNIRLKELRTAKHLSQTQLGQKTDVSQSVISKIENGILFPNSQIIIRFSAFFHVSTDYFLGLTNEKCSPALQTFMRQHTQHYNDMLHTYASLPERDQLTAFNLISDIYKRNNPSIL